MFVTVKARVYTDATGVYTEIPTLLTPAGVLEPLLDLTDVGLQGYVGGVDISGSMGEPRINDVESLSKQIMVKLKDPQKAHYDAASLLSKIVELKLDPIQRFSDYLDGLN